VELCVKIAAALEHAHESGVVHRDMKPSNVMLTVDDEPHVMDFGLAKRDAGEITMTVEGKVLGTPAYMPPEQASGEGHHVDRRADVYSLGVILYELLSGNLPFRGNTRMLLHQVIHDEAPSPRKLNSSIPRDLETITLKCLQKAVSQRYQTAQALADDMTCWLEGKPITARPSTWMERTWRWCKRQPAVAILCVTLPVLLLTIIGVWNAAVVETRVQFEKNRANNYREKYADAAIEIKNYRQMYADAAREIKNYRQMYADAAIEIKNYRQMYADAAREIKKLESLLLKSDSELEWEQFSPQRLTEITAQQKTVFLDFTADWCLTCKHNEAVALNVKKMKDYVEANGIVMMKADKTKTSNWPEIDELLVKLGNRTKQIPFYAIFPAGRPNDPIVMDKGIYTSPAPFIEKLKEADPKTAGAAETGSLEPGG